MGRLYDLTIMCKDKHIFCGEWFTTIPQNVGRRIGYKPIDMKMRTNIFFVETPHGASLRFNNNAQRQIHFFVGNGLQPFRKMLAGGSVINRSI